MKLLKVTINNLNSLYGEHVIDFDNDLARSPLFLIIGPTGAGKSTILDAICLSLFGQTPRLSKDTGNPDKDPALIMSYGTGRCEAALEFSKRDRDGERRRYRAVWSCRRARDKPSGNLQDPERGLILLHDDGTEEVLISDKRKKYYLPIFDDVLEGLEVEDFQRSVLLAQGEFAAFLKADESVKANILERLTSTDEYKLIGQRAAKKRRTVEQELKQLTAKLNGISLLDKEEEQELEDSLIFLQEELQKLKVEFDQIQTITRWLQREEELNTRVSDATQALEQYTKDLAERAEDLQRLQEDERCRITETPLQQFDDATTKRATIQSELEAHQPQLDTLLTQRTRQTQAHDQATETLNQAQRSLDQALPDIQRGEQLVQTIDVLQSDAHTLRQELEQAADNLKEAKLQLDGVQRQHEQALERQLAAKAQCAEVAHLAPLKASFGALETQTQYANDAVIAVSAAQEKVDGHQATITSTTNTINTATTSIETIKASITPQLNAVDGAKKNILRLLEGHDTVQDRRAAIEALSDRAVEQQHFALDAKRLGQTLESTFQRHTAQQESQTSTAKTIESLNGQLTTLKQEHDKTAELLHEQEDAIHDIDLALALSDKRKALQKDDPCPLCGSLDHPLLKEHDVDELTKTLEDKRDQKTKRRDATASALKDVANEIRQVELDLTKHQTNLDTALSTQATLKAQIQEHVTALNDALTHLDQPTISQYPTKATAQRMLNQRLAQLVQTVEQDVARHKEALDILRKAQHTLDDAETSLKAVEEQLRSQEEALKSHTQQLAFATQQRDEAMARLQVQASKRDALLNTLKEAFEKFELSFDANNLDTSLNSAKASMQAYTAAQDAVEHTTQSVERFERQREQLTSEHKHKTQAHEKLATTHAAKRELIEKHNTTLQELFGEDTPATRRKTLEETVHKARQTKEHAAKALGETREAAASAESTQNARRAQCATLDAQIEAVRETIQTHLKTLDLDNIEALRAILLDPQTRQHLQDTLKTLQKDHATAQLNVEANKGLLEKHMVEIPEHPSLRKRSQDAWKKQYMELDGKIESQHEDIGAVRERLKTQLDAKAQAAQFKDELQEKRKHYRVWETIHRLIGAKDGDAFKQFAQSLNLQELVDRANIRLKSLAPRYKLAVATGDQGEPKLNFTVRDTHQANFDRPLTTLSGGETFLVSLALALALADFKRIDMPVETLLLDEGFGTLDQDTLDVAMNTLRQLQHESAQQIGIISHVEALKERIDTRILVEKQGNGRSVMHFEIGGRRIR